MAGVGVKFPAFGRSVSEGSSAITYAPAVSMGRVVRVSIQWMMADGTVFGDDALAESENGITGMTVDVETTEMSPDAEVEVLGVEKDGDAYWDTGDSGPDGKLVYIRVLKEHGKYLYRVDTIPKISFGRNNEDMQTKGQTVTFGTHSVHGTGKAFFNSASGKSRFRKKRYFQTWESAYAYYLAEAGISGYTTSLVLNTTAATVAAGSTVTLTAVSAPSGATASTIVWTSDNETVATVEDGVVTGVAAGTAIISGSYGGVTASCRVTVTAA